MPSVRRPFKFAVAEKDDDSLFATIEADSSVCDASTTATPLLVSYCKPPTAPPSAATPRFGALTPEPNSEAGAFCEPTETASVFAVACAVAVLPATVRLRPDTGAEASIRAPN